MSPHTTFNNINHHKFLSTLYQHHLLFLAQMNPVLVSFKTVVPLFFALLAFDAVFGKLLNLMSHYVYLIKIRLC